MNKISVFIVEDEPIVLEVNIGFLEKMDEFSLIGMSTSGKDALEKIKKLKPKLVLLDMFLPDISGLDVLVQLRTERIPSDIIMITAARDAGTIQEVMRLGAIDYLVKPFRFQRFQQSLQNYCKMVGKIESLQMLNQEDIDKWLGNSENGIDLPKGLNEFTMKQILLGLGSAEPPITAEQLGQNLGMARVTVRKYLDFLAGKDKVQIELQYGNVGRPTKYYSLK
ncbi:response regulator [Neobacillus mesonae]|uniref:Two-component system response regulator n=1 Tax=Neobacillus mesonae TaxID=1193713 RepID=A0A3Q9QYC7_9BACI|nr:response regulator [Neobacillus mesonae]AZU64346.1 two-component system response regulator [Neobacillus mesonae]MED4203569.1 response regulator [Neobacillus mesonae]